MAFELNKIVNRLLAPLGVRVVNRMWGPREFSQVFEKLKTQGFNPHQIVDVGAYHGDWTRECMQIFPDARYFLVDPLTQNAPLLRQLCAERPNCRFFHGGLGEQSETRTIYSTGMRSSFLKSDVFDQSRTETMEIRTLDSFLGTPDLEPPDLIKADVQGYELKVLEGGQKCLESTKALLLEVSFRATYVDCPLAHEVIAHLGRWGYAIHDICTYMIDDRNGDLLQSDLLFCRQDSPWLHYHA